MSDAESIITKLNEINDFISMAQIKLGQGEVVKLSHLDAEVEQICNQALALPPIEAKKTQSPMMDMIGNLDTLANALKDFQAQLKATQS